MTRLDADPETYYFAAQAASELGRSTEAASWLEEHQRWRRR